MRRLLNRLLLVMYARVSVDNILQLAPVPCATAKHTISDIVSLHQSGLLTREESRGVLSGVLGVPLSS